MTFRVNSADVRPLPPAGFVNNDVDWYSLYMTEMHSDSIMLTAHSYYDHFHFLISDISTGRPVHTAIKLTQVSTDIWTQLSFLTNIIHNNSALQFTW